MNRLFQNPLLIIIGIAVILCSGSLSASAQQVSIIRGARVPQLGRLPTNRPRPLSIAQKLQAAQSVVSRRGTRAVSLANALLLTPGKFITGPARLRLFNPSIVDADDGIPRAAFFEDSEKVVVSFTPTSPGLYLFDFALGGTGPYKLAGNGVTQSTATYSDHLLFVAEATQTTVIDLILSGEGTWTFYSCEISQIK